MAWRVLRAPGVADEVANPAEHVQQKLAGQTSGAVLHVYSDVVSGVQHRNAARNERWDKKGGLDERSAARVQVSS